MQNIHRKQFIIMQHSFDFGSQEEWAPKHGTIFNKYNIYYDIDLKIKFGKYGVLIGEVYNGDKNAPIPCELLKKDMDNPSEMYETWNGRWILIYKNKIFLDANSQLSLFYGNIENIGWIFSSSLALINLVTYNMLEKEEFMPLDMTFRSELYFNPGPLTLLKGIKRLMTTQSLEITGNDVKIVGRDPININDFSALKTEEIYEAIYEQIVIAVTNALKDYPKIDMALTAGRDSRMQLAILHHADIPVALHTFERTKSTSVCDERIAYKIAKKLKKDWKYIPLEERVDASRVISYCKHTFNNVRTEDYRWHYTYHQLDKLQGDIYIKAGLWEGFCNYYLGFEFTEIDYSETTENIMQQLYSLYATLRGNVGAEKSFTEYITWVKKFPIENMTLADRIAYEQLYGCWCSDVAQGRDFAWKGFSWDLANSMRIFSLIAALPREKRDGRIWQEEMVKKYCPCISNIPYNKNPITIKYIGEKLEYIKRKYLFEC